MTSHLILPYKWVNCVNLENCSEHIHHEEAANTLNSYPLSWVASLLSCRVTTNRIVFLDDVGRNHKNDGPAVIEDDGRQEWWRNGKLHRENGPAVTTKNNAQEWWFDGQVHREDGPALIYPGGAKKWYQNDVLHRIDGPAIEWFRGAEAWYTEGVKHRVGGPAVTYADEVKEWWLNGVRQPDPKIIKKATS